MEVLIDDMKKSFKAIEIASILFCMYLEFDLRRDIGFVKFSRYARQKYISFFSKEMRELLGLDIHIVGSVAEGLNGPNSDTDFMFSFKNGICCDADLVREDTGVKKVFLADCVNASPGYVLLWDASYIKEDIRIWKPLKLDADLEENSLVSIMNSKGDMKVLGRFNMMVLNNRELTYDLLHSNMTRNGPAISFVPSVHAIISYFKIDVGENMNKLFRIIVRIFSKQSIDQVFALPFQCKTSLNSFINRRRRYGWPSKRLLKEIKGIPAYVVPVGQKGSRFGDKEWRVSYTLTETHLIKSLNEVQLMLLYQLKEVAKEHLATICPDISSYVIKNLVLWIIKCSPPEYFQYKNFIPLYKSFLVILRKRILEGCIPNYLIPDRNLFENKLSLIKRFRLYWRLTRLKKCGLVIGSFSQIYKTIACQKIDLLQNKIENEKFNMIRHVNTETELLHVVSLLIRFVSVNDLFAALEKISPKIPSEIPLD